MIEAADGSNGEFICLEAARYAGLQFENVDMFPFVKASESLIS